MVSRTTFPPWLRLSPNQRELALYIVLMLLMPLFQIGLQQIADWLAPS